MCKICAAHTFILSEPYYLMTTKYFLSCTLVLAFLVPAAADARTSLEVAGWIPYWSDTDGVASAKKHIRDLDTIHPFAFEVQNDGTLKDRADLDESKWKKLFKTAKKRRVDIVPTVTWFNAAEIHAVLSDKKKRRAHIDAIVEMVDEGRYDGVDIDYEGKWAQTKEYFSLFLKELEDELGRDMLTCTVEARTPPESLYRDVPDDIQYANDYRAINRYCDRVEIMAYDQQRADLTLNSEKRGEPYNPVADADWVEKVIKLALKDIDEDKIMLGVPTYGREWTITVEPEWYKSYERISARNMPRALEIADEYDIKPGRNKAGELSFTYFPESSIWNLLNVLPAPKGTTKGNEAAAKALLFANATGRTVTVNYVTMSDADAIEEKMDLAEKYDLRGIAIFKIDGDEDEEIWDLF